MRILSFLHSAVALDPNNCFARMKLAVVHSRSGQLQQVCTRFCFNFPKSYHIPNLTLRQALTELELVRQLQPKSMETLFALGKLLFRMGNTSLALVRCMPTPFISASSPITLQCASL